MERYAAQFTKPKLKQLDEVLYIWFSNINPLNVAVSDGMLTYVVTTLETNQVSSDHLQNLEAFLNK